MLKLNFNHLHTTDNSKTTLKFGLLCDNLTLQRWQVMAIDSLIKNNIQLAVVVLNANKSEKISLFRKIKNYPYQKLLFRIWSRYLFKPKSKISEDIHELVSDIPILECKTEQKKISTYFFESDIQKIKQLNLDFLLRFGFDIIRGDILESAKYGVWSFHHDDEMLFRGTPPGFWEIVYGHHTNGIILQKLTNSLDKGFILKKVYLKTIKHSYKAHLNQLLFESVKMPLQVCKEILVYGEPKMALSESKAKIFYPPNNFRMLAFWLQMLWNRISFHLNDLFCQEDWNVGYAEKPLSDFIRQSNISNSDVYWLKKPSNSQYLADPFIVKTQSDTFIFFEWYDYSKGKACLANAKKSEEFKVYHKIFEDSFHHSFPFTFEYKDVIYCLPESNQSNKLTLYRFDEKENRLIFECQLLDNIRAVDPILYKHQGIWYLLLTKKEMACAQLYIYYSDSPFGPFQEHFNNPVKTSISSSRMAGKIFSLDNQIIRPAQECSKHYGSAVILNEIIELSPEKFEETFYKKIEPIRESKFSKGLHTLNGDCDFTVFDGKRFSFSFQGFKQQFKQKLKGK